MCSWVRTAWLGGMPWTCKSDARNTMYDMDMPVGTETQWPNLAQIPWNWCGTTIYAYWRCSSILPRVRGIEVCSEAALTWQ